MKSTKQSTGWLVLIFVNVIGFSLIALCLLIGLQGCRPSQLSVKIIPTASNGPIFDFRTSHFIPVELKFRLENESLMGYLNVCKVDENGQKKHTYWRIIIMPDDAPQRTVDQIIATHKKYYPNFIEYGKVPFGWKQEVVPRSLDDGLYSINDFVFFVRKGNSYIVLPSYSNQKQLADQLRQANEALTTR